MCVGIYLTKKIFLTSSTFNHPCVFDLSELILIIYADTKGADPSLMHGYDSRTSIYNNPTRINIGAAQICDDSNPSGSMTIWPDLSSPSIRICAEHCAYTNDINNLYTPESAGAMITNYESTSFMHSSELQRCRR